jgi:hypothetical protein
MERVLPQRDLPYSSHAITQELIDGDTQRSKDIAAKWQEKSLKIKRTDRDWRWIEFLIKSTNDYDDGVGPDVNVLQIPEGHQATWRKNLTCAQQPTNSVKRRIFAEEVQ